MKFANFIKVNCKFCDAIEELQPIYVTTGLGFNANFMKLLYNENCSTILVL